MKPVSHFKVEAEDPNSSKKEPPFSDIAHSLGEALSYVDGYTSLGYPQVKAVQFNRAGMGCTTRRPNPSTYNACDQVVVIDPTYEAIVDHLPITMRRTLMAGELDINENNEKTTSPMPRQYCK